MYKRTSSEPFNAITRSVKVKVKVAEPRAPGKPKKEERKTLQAKCPHLRSDNTCARMIKEGLDGNVSDSDVEHFCNGTPILCYYFRLPPPKNK